VKDRARLFVLVGTALVLAVALTVFGSGSETTTEATTSTFADIAIPDPPLPTTTVARARVVSPVPTEHAYPAPIEIPGLVGRLVVVTGQSPRHHTLVVVDIESGDLVDTALPSVASEFTIDASGRSLSFVGGTDGAQELHVLPITTPLDAVTIPGASGLVWSGDEPRTAAWLEDGVVALGTFRDDGSTGTSILGMANRPHERLAGLTASGWWTTFVDVSRPRSGIVEFSTRTERAAGWRFPGDIVVPPQSGSRALIARLDIATWRWTFGIGGSDIDPLPWAPGDAAGEYGFAAFSRAGSRIAFIGVHEPGASWVEIQSPEGGPVDRIVLPVRVWDVTWSPDGLFVVMPGSDDAGRHTVVLVDTATGDIHTIPFDDRVQFATVVPAAHAMNDGGPDGA
jgi:hypothetical protein